MKKEWQDLTIVIKFIELDLDEKMFDSGKGEIPSITFQKIDNATHLCEVATDQLLQTNKLISSRHAEWHSQDLHFWQKYLKKYF